MSAGNALLGEPRIVVTPHIAGSMDLMLDGSVKFLGEVLENYRKDLKSAGVLNEPKKPRVQLRWCGHRKRSDLRAQASDLLKRCFR